MYNVHSIRDLPHRNLSNKERVLFTDGLLFEVQNWQFEDGIYLYFLRRILKNGKEGKTFYVITYTTKNGTKIKCHRK